MNYVDCLLIVPLVSSLLLFFIPDRLVKKAAVVLSIVCLSFALYSSGFIGGHKMFSWGVFDRYTTELRLDWISYFLVLLNSLLTLVCVYSSVGISVMPKLYYSAFFFSLFACNGVFIAADTICFYIFWELTLLPMFFLIGIWGGANRIYATVKFLVYTLFGSLAMLGAIIYMYYSFGTASFSRLPSLVGDLTISAQQILFLCFFLAFSIKVPVFPFHTWLPDAHVEAPTAGSVILAGILLKLGTYAYVRVLVPLFGAVARDFSVYIVILGVIGIIYGAFMSFIQSDIKKIIAYSSVSHMGFVILGIFSFNSTGWNGAYMQMINHGISTGALFLLVGIIYYKTHERDIEAFGGLASKMGIYSAFFLVAMLSSIGLPGLNGFVGEFLVLAGTYKSYGYVALLAATGVILSACYMFRIWNNVFWGPEKKEVADIGTFETSYLVTLTILMVVLGIYPSLILDRIQWTF